MCRYESVKRKVGELQNGLVCAEQGQFWYSDMLFPMAEHSRRQCSDANVSEVLTHAGSLDLDSDPRLQAELRRVKLVIVQSNAKCAA